MRLTASLWSRRRWGEYTFDKEADDIAKHDYLILAFTHHKQREYPAAMQKLLNRYTLHLTLLNKAGRGIVVLKITNKSPASG